MGPLGVCREKGEVSNGRLQASLTFRGRPWHPAAVEHKEETQAKDLGEGVCAGRVVKQGQWQRHMPPVAPCSSLCGRVRGEGGGKCRLAVQLETT